MRSLLLYAVALALLAIVAVTSSNEAKTTFHLPIQRTVGRSRKRDDTDVVGLGDVMDVTYSVLVQVGKTLTPLVIDTGSADLWLVSDGCTGRCLTTGIPIYSRQTLTPTGQDVSLLYGDSRTGTHASGPICTDTVGVADFSVPDQYFAAITDTNTSVLETGSAGILGLGFPPISVIWRQLLSAELDWSGPPSSASKRSFNKPDYRSRSLPSFDFLSRNDSSWKRQDAQLPLASPMDSFPRYGPMFTRLVTWNLLSRPLVVATLQRDTVSLSGNAGTLSLGALPFGLTDESLTWVPVRGYTASEGGLPPPSQAPDEVYPLVWEIPIDEVYFDGVKLQRSKLSPPSISLSALVDTGNSLIRGPQDVVAQISELLDDPASGMFDCSIPHNLTFDIGGVSFSVDPRDFAQPAPVIPGTVYPDEAARCTPALAATDPPGHGGFLYSWSLGAPFLKSALVAFYYGNMTHPSRDPPRVGFLSTVPSNANHALEDAVASAIKNGGIFPSTSEAAPYATAMEVHTVTFPNVDPEMTQGSQRVLSGAVSVAAGTVNAQLWAAALTLTVLAGVFAYL